MTENRTRLGVEQAQPFLDESPGRSLSLYAHLDSAAAELLAQSDRASLCLDGIGDLPDEAARHLGQYAGADLSLNGLHSLSERSAQGLGQFTGALHLNALQDLPLPIATALTSHGGPLYLDGLRSLSSEVANLLVQHPKIHLRLNRQPVASVVDLLKASARMTGRMCRRSHKTKEGLVYTDQGWPAAMPRRDFYIQNDDPTHWCLSSAIYQALMGEETVEDARNGWFLGWEVEEINYMRFVLEDHLTLSEQQATLASGTWPLLRIPDGLLIAGSTPCCRAQLDISPEGEFEIKVNPHDRFVVVRVPPGCYSVGIHQLFDSCYTVTLHRLKCDCPWDPEKVAAAPNVHADCPGYLPLTPSPGVSGWAPEKVNGLTARNHVGSLKGIRHCENPPRPAANLQPAKRSAYTSALYGDVDEIRTGWTQTLPGD